MGYVRFGEGDWFAVPLEDGGFGVGVVARYKRAGSIVLGYFFGPRHSQVPVLGDVADLRLDQAVLVAMFGYLGLRDGGWPVLGRLPGWRREDWPMPVFIRREELTGRTFRSFYDPDDPGTFLRQQRIPPGTVEQGPRDSTMGPGFLEARLTRLLQQGAGPVAGGELSAGLVEPLLVPSRRPGGRFDSCDDLTTHADSTVGSGNGRRVEVGGRAGPTGPSGARRVPMRYSLVVQWPFSSRDDLRALLAVEEVLEGVLGSHGRVDGNDFGSGTMNIFIDTDRPAEAFSEIRAALEGGPSWHDLRAAYRPVEGDRYTVLWPPTLKRFSIMEEEHG